MFFESSFGQTGIARRRAMVCGVAVLAALTSLLAPAAQAARGGEVVIDDAEVGNGVNQWSYDADWQFTSGEAEKLGGGDHYSYVKGSIATLQFSGTGVALYSTVRPWHGVAEFAIDGDAPSKVDEYSPTDGFQELVYESPTLEDGMHVLTVTHTGVGNADNPEAIIAVAVDKTVVTTSASSILSTKKKPTVTTASGGSSGPWATRTATPKATTTPRAKTPSTGGPAASPGSMPAITVSGDQIMRGNEPWWFVGSNSFVWSGDCGNDDEKMNTEMLEAYFASMRTDGHAAVRLFFYSGWNAEALDNAVAFAKQYNVYLTITLDDAIGGCGENDKTPEWFSDASEISEYEAHLTDLVTKYQGETAFAWFEYFNEPGGDNTAQQLRDFYDQMGALSDSIDPDRLWASGTVAPYWLDGEANFELVSSSPGVDIASMHEYDENEVASNHTDGVVANSGGKPVIVGEFGITAGAGGDCVSFSERASRVEAKIGAYTTTPGVVGGFYWAWQPGGGGCEYGNLDEDTDTQSVLANYMP